MTREEWLKAAEASMQHWITELGYSYPSNTRVSCGFPKASRGRNHSIGQCWTNTVSADGTHEMFISPTQANAARVCDILLHEMTHATIGVAHGHKKPFIKLARALGLEGKITATKAGEALTMRICDLLLTLPPYPHAELSPGANTTPKQKTALLKVECAACGYVARVTAKWLDAVGAPICPCNEQPMERIQ
jgi:ribosomal protein L37E